MGQADQITRNLRDGSILIKDGSATTPNSITLEIEEGNMSFTEDRTARIISDRGALSHRRTGDEVACAVSFGVKFCKYASESSEEPTVRDALTGQGEASSWVSTGNAGEPYTPDLEFRVANPDAEGHREDFLFTDFHADTLEFSEGDEYDTLSVSGTALIVGPTVTHTAQS